MFLRRGRIGAIWGRFVQPRTFTSTVFPIFTQNGREMYFCWQNIILLDCTSPFISFWVWTESAKVHPLLCKLLFEFILVHDSFFMCEDKFCKDVQEGQLQQEGQLGRHIVPHRLQDLNKGLILAMLAAGPIHGWQAWPCTDASVRSSSKSFPSSQMAFFKFFFCFLSTWNPAPIQSSPKSLTPSRPWSAAVYQTKF